ncbi:uncharacterized protein LOC125041549 [Penaeus chinensis]|uniref:uncharacterized protein LOC125041549 n=1 Tax=Penaeus chinensis TaxID=139456 RepID=UPI001FB6C13C|nr:uncharacterized protein LOC125041549 [Penaeus chinensis]
MSIRRVSRACLTYRPRRPDKPDRSPARETDRTSLCSERENTFQPVIVSYCSVRASGKDEDLGNGGTLGRTILVDLEGRRVAAAGVSRAFQHGRGEARAEGKASDPEPNETRSEGKDGDPEPYDTLKYPSAESFLDHLLDEDDIALLDNVQDILSQDTCAGVEATEEGPRRGADKSCPSSSWQTDDAVRGESDADIDSGGVVAEDDLDRWEEWVLFVAVDVVSGLQMVIPAKYVRLASIPWHVLLPGDPLCLPKDNVVLMRKRVLASTARGSDSSSSASSESGRQAKVKEKRPRSRTKVGPGSRFRGRRSSRIRGRPLPPCLPPRPPERESGLGYGCPLPLHLPKDSPSRRTAQWILSEFQGDGFLAALEVETQCGRCDSVLSSVDEAARHYEAVHSDRRNCPFCCVIMSRDGIFWHMRRHYVGLAFR